MCCATKEVVTISLGFYIYFVYICVLKMLCLYILTRIVYTLFLFKTIKPQLSSESCENEKLTNVKINSC